MLYKRPQSTLGRLTAWHDRADCDKNPELPQDQTQVMTGATQHDIHLVTRAALQNDKTPPPFNRRSSLARFKLIRFIDIGK